MTDNTELKSAIEYILNQGALEREFIEDADLLDAAWAVYDALGPADILALIAENDALKGPHDWLAEDLIKELVDNAQSFQENACEEGEDPFVIVLLAAASRIRRQEVHIDKLRAEVAGLKTGYEAYEQVVQGLKAVNEALRKDAERWRFFSVLANDLQAFPHSWGQMTPEKMDFMCDEAMAYAAMGKGEQS